MNYNMIKLTFLLLSVITLAAAQSVGTKSFYFLQICRATGTLGMGETYAANQESAEGVFLNPASPAFAKRQSGGLISFNKYVSSLLSYGGAAYVRLPGKLMISAAANGLSYGKTIGYIENASDAGKEIASGNFAALLGAALPLEKGAFRLSLGASLRYANEKAAEAKLSALSADLGTIASIGNANQRISLGVHAKNLGVNFALSGEGKGLPLSTVAGLGYNGDFAPGKFALKILSDVRLSSSEKLSLHEGLEAGIFEKVFIRAGTAITPGSSVKADLSTGLGVRLPMNAKTEIEFDYALVRKGDLGLSHDMQLGFFRRLGEAKVKAGKTEKAEAAVKTVPVVPTVEMSAPEASTKYPADYDSTDVRKVSNETLLADAKNKLQANDAFAAMQIVMKALSLSPYNKDARAVFVKAFALLNEEQKTKVKNYLESMKTKNSAADPEKAQGYAEIAGLI